MSKVWVQSQHRPEFQLNGLQCPHLLLKQSFRSVETVTGSSVSTADLSALYYRSINVKSVMLNT